MIKVNGNTIKFNKFPNNETLVDTSNLNSIDGLTRIDFKWESDEDLVQLCFVLGHIPNDKILTIWYMPYSRMDRSENGSCFTLKHTCTIINSFIKDNDRVYILEPHSDKTLELLKNSERINMITPLMQTICETENIDIICYPDKGAKLRFESDVVDKPIIYCEKIRDFDTGNILGLEIKSDIDIKDKNILILDDLCSRGGTFYHTAKALKERGANNIFLGVCHMEATLLCGDLYRSELVSKIYCLNTILNKEQVRWLSDKVVVFDTLTALLTNHLDPIRKEEKIC